MTMRLPFNIQDLDGFEIQGKIILGSKALHISTGCTGRHRTEPSLSDSMVCRSMPLAISFLISNITGTQPKAFGSFYQLTAPGAHVWQCSMDGIKFGHPPPPSGNISGNNYLLCDGGKINVTDGTHTLTIDIFITSKKSTFWFDWIEYLPSANVPLDNATVLVNHDDPIIHYDASWQPPTGLLSMTTVPGSTANVQFAGTILSRLLPEVCDQIVHR